VNLEQLRARHAEIVSELRELNTTIGEADPTEEQRARWDALDAEETSVQAQIEERQQRADRVRSLPELGGRTERGDGARPAPNVIVKDDPFDLLRTAQNGAPVTRAQLIDANLRAMEGRIDDGANQAHFERLLKRHAVDRRWALNLLGRATEDYASGFAKVMTGHPETLTNEERAAIAVGTNTQGGYLVPTHLDPTLILTNVGSSNVIRQLARTVTLTEGNVWNGVTTAGVTASWDAQLAEVSDDSPSFAAASVSIHKAQGLVGASIEAIEDIAGLQSDVMMLFADARDRLEGAAHATGSGSGQPKGIVTALDASTGVEITSTTAATIGEVDIHAMYRAVGVRWRGRGTWIMNPLYSLAIKRLGTAVSSSYSGDLTVPVTDRILGRPAVDSDDMPTTQNTTELNPEIVYGDFSNYLIVDKPGSTSIEFIPHLFHTSNNLPYGARAWYMHFRSGADAVNLAAFRLLLDKTSA
jgi:HK97 family phage major capsid protein